MAGKHRKAAAIIPAYNEESRIQPVLRTLVAHPLIDEVIVVNDGSTDKTEAMAAALTGIRVLNLPRNHGKAAAILTGARATDADLLLFVDADLVGFEEKHVRSLLEPLLSDKSLAMTVGRFINGRSSTNLSQRLVPTLSGQRAIRHEVLDSAIGLDRTGFAFETVLTGHVKQAGLPIREVQLPNVTHVMKEEKRGFVRGFTQRLFMYGEIFYHLFRLRIQKPTLDKSVRRLTTVD